MKDSTKKYLKVSVTLASICSVSALLIGLVNFLTADTIKANENAVVVAGLKNVYPNAEFGSVVTINDDSYSENGYSINIISYWVAAENDAEVGYVFKTSGSNTYGSIITLIGVSDAGLGTIYLVSSSQTRTDYIDGYLTPYNEGTNKDTDIDTVQCGATYAAKLISRNGSWSSIGL
jgi:hypothetical protein